MAAASIDEGEGETAEDDCREFAGGEAAVPVFVVPFEEKDEVARGIGALTSTYFCFEKRLIFFVCLV